MSARCENRPGAWQWKAPPLAARTLAGGLRVVPVVRLTSETRQPFAPAALRRPGGRAARVAGESGAVQLDFDCPDRLLPALRGGPARDARGAATSHHHRARALAAGPGFAALTRGGRGNRTDVLRSAGRPDGRERERTATAAARSGAVRSRAAPVERVPDSVARRAADFRAPHRLRPHRPLARTDSQLVWDDFCFHKSLHTLAPTRLGVTLFRADTDTRVAATPVAKDEIVASRFTDRAALAPARGAGARPPAPRTSSSFACRMAAATGGWSLRILAKLGASEHPRLILRATADDRLELVNDSAIDLAPRLSGEKNDRDRGYALEIDAPAPLFREALAGDFWRVGSHAEPDGKKPVAVAVPLATRLTFWFSHLRAGETLQTGLWQLAPGASLADASLSNPATAKITTYGNRSRSLSPPAPAP